MLRVFYGNDIIGARTKARNAARKELNEHDELVELTPENYSEGAIAEMAGGISLFSGPRVVFFDTPSERPEMYAELVSNIELVSSSSNTFFLAEGTLDTESKQLFVKYAQEVSEIKKKHEERFNTFSMADALLARDKKSLWILLNEAWRAGFTNEEIIGALMWQLKTVRLVERVKSIEETNLKPFVYNKAKRALAKFKKGDADRLARELVTLYHEGHEGKRDLGLALEAWTLSL